MQTVNPTVLRQKARELSRANRKWHFHIFTPDCKLNEKKEFAFIVEDASEGETYVHYSSVKLVDLGRELVQLLHGKDVLKKDAEASVSSPTIGIIVDRAKDLNDSGKAWHHHMLFPDCDFNPHEGAWTLLFEDPVSVEVLESVTDEEPKKDLKEIESLFYAQKF